MTEENSGTTIYIPRYVLEDLKELKIISDESYYRVIIRLIDHYRDSK